MTEPATLPLTIDPEAEVYNARLVRREDETDSLSYFWVRFDGEETPFLPGQYMTIGGMANGRMLQRPYSVASPAAAVSGRVPSGDRRDGRLRVLRPAGPGRLVHAGLVRSAGGPSDADDR